MSKLLFVHTGEKVKIDSNDLLYTDGSYSKEVWKRYLKYFDSISIFMRKDYSSFSDEELKSKFNLVPDGFSFYELKDCGGSIVKFLDPRIKKYNFELFKKLVDEHDFVIVRVPGMNEAIGYLNKIRKPYLIEVVGCPFDSLWNHSWKGKILAPISYLSMKRTVKKAKNAMYVTNEFLQKRYPCHNYTIGCSDVIIKDQSNNDFLIKRSNRIHTDGSVYTIGTIGAIDVKYKGQANVIKAIFRLKKMGIIINYKLVGQGNINRLDSLANKLKIRNQVTFMGPIPHSQIFDWLEGLDLYIQPSQTEGLPRSLIEAMSLAVPCLGSDVGGIPELLSSDMLFNKKSIKAITAKLKVFLTDDKKKLDNSNYVYNVSQKYKKENLEKIRDNFYFNVKGD